MSCISALTEACEKVTGDLGLGSGFPRGLALTSRTSTTYNWLVWNEPNYESKRDESGNTKFQISSIHYWLRGGLNNQLGGNQGMTLGVSLGPRKGLLIKLSLV